MYLNTTNQIETTGPVAAAERIKTIDIVRGVALLGILLMNIPGFGIDWGSGIDPIRRGPHNTADFRIRAVISIFFSSTMFGLFSMLFGSGMILFTMNKKEIVGGVTVAELYYRRLLVLVMFTPLLVFKKQALSDLGFFTNNPIILHLQLLVK